MINNQLTGNVFKIETFGSVDGPGVRLVIFLQGCDFRCKYCHNPEGWLYQSPNAKQYTVDQIINLFERNKSFYGNGGITLSGGDPMVQHEFVLALSQQSKKNNIHLTIDTSACNFFNNKKTYEKLLDFVNLWLVDIKSTTIQEHKNLTGCDKLTGIEFINFLEQHHKPYWVRYVLVKDFNDSQKHIESLANVLNNKTYLERYEILPYHNLALNKYAKLKIVYQFKDKKIMSNEEIDNFKFRLSNLINKK